jgi:hypothetical protein
MRSMFKGLLWPVLAFVGLAVGLCTGYAAKGIEDDLQAASIEGLCRPSKSWTAYVSEDASGYVCFKQQKFNKRIIRYNIVERE